MSNQDVYIWNPANKIQDIPVDWSELEAPELRSVRIAWTAEQERLKALNLLDEFTRQLRREWAIETGVIENLYEFDRGVTATLIQQGFDAVPRNVASKKPRDWVVRMLNNQLGAIYGVFDFINNERELATSFVKELQSALLNGETDVEAVDSSGRIVQAPLILGDWKKLLNYPVRDGKRYLYCPPEHVASEMDRLIEMHSDHLRAGVPAEVEAAFLHHRFSQIHPFQDGNGRVARALASLVFIKAGLFPLIVSNSEREAYIGALEKADFGDLKPLIDLFASLQRARFRKATDVSAQTLADTESAALASLSSRINDRKRAKQAELENVFGHAQTLANSVFDKLNELKPKLDQLMKELASNGFAIADKATDSNGHFFRYQIVTIARDHLFYFASTKPHSDWVRLRLKWERSANIVYAFHSLGHEFAGVLVCAPFIEFVDKQSSDEEPNESDHQASTVTRTLLPISAEAFEFYHSEDIEALQKRFDGWLKESVIMAIAQLEKNL